jgi:hypothetical protein
MHKFHVILTAFYCYAVYVQRRLLFTHFSLLTLLHVRSNQPSSGVQAVVIKESTAHCNAVLFLLYSCIRLHLVMWVSHMFYLGVVELNLFAYL